MTQDQKQALTMLRATFRKIASSADDHPYWKYVSNIDSMLETGKCKFAETPDELIDDCADELVAFAERAQA
jgi:hypothetical protein